MTYNRITVIIQQPGKPTAQVIHFQDGIKSSGKLESGSATAKVAAALAERTEVKTTDLTPANQLA